MGGATIAWVFMNLISTSKPIYGHTGTLSTGITKIMSVLLQMLQCVITKSLLPSLYGNMLLLSTSIK